MRTVIWWLAAAVALGSANAEDKPAYTFGTTVVDSSGLQGRLYHLKTQTERLPKFERMRPVGSVYTTMLDVWPQDFSEGFPSITDRFEWFGIEYTGKFWIENTGQYKFSLLADDGAKLYIDGKVVIDNDGLHRAVAVSAGATLTHGVHDIKIDYFQGPRFTVALVLSVSARGEPWRIFNMRDFMPPKERDQWEPGHISGILDPTTD